MWRIIHLPSATVLKQFGKLKDFEHAKTFIDRHYFYMGHHSDPYRIHVQQKHTTYYNSPVVELDKCEFEPIEVSKCGH